MKLLLECGEYVTVANHPEGSYVLEFDLGGGVKVLRIGDNLKIISTKYINVKQLAAINELINCDKRFFYNIYMNI